MLIPSYFAGYTSVRNLLKINNMCTFLITVSTSHISISSLSIFVFGAFRDRREYRSFAFPKQSEPKRLHFTYDSPSHVLQRQNKVMKTFPNYICHVYIFIFVMNSNIRLKFSFENVPLLIDFK